MWKTRPGGVTTESIPDEDVDSFAIAVIVTGDDGPVRRPSMAGERASVEGHA